MLNFVKSLTHWFVKNQRNLPWRLTSDPYRIWVSEVMLQQTQVSTVIPYYEKFLTAFPDLKSLAKAPEEKALQLWAGLGYYSRARNLHRGAQYLVSQCESSFPKTREAILKIPGIGPYTAGAVLSIAFNLKEPLVDGNVERVFSRYFGYEEPIDTVTAKKFFWKKAEELVHLSKEPRLFNQSLMELGSLICTKANPQCDNCPVQRNCLAFHQDLTQNIPRKQKKTKYKEVYQVKFIFENQGKVFVRQNLKTEWWAGLWDFPSVELKAPQNWTAEIEELVKAHSPLTWRELSHQKHTVTHHKLSVIPLHLKLRKKPSLEGQWVASSQLRNLPVSALVRRIWDQNF